MGIIASPPPALDDVSTPDLALQSPDPVETMEDGEINTEPQPPTLEDGVWKEEEDNLVLDYFKSFAVTLVIWDPESKVQTPILLQGTLHSYQQSGLEWLASLHSNNLDGILADKMGLGKTIQTIVLLVHLACDQGIWGPHLIVSSGSFPGSCLIDCFVTDVTPLVPTSVGLTHQKCQWLTCQ
ncbi:hypothetical protein PILCRDRAFT_688535 [Piloderma croceum F 1598]|uniref:SNF2 N-terminal domain-containing protein n=1 Tax=Piloderma croceum (strain F 1598) TaxID=765440 RepID=A0A0C3BCV9_PILCF|nr:hypothetical protein PILCRDRAFT_688535 [Piloderma croceum F 1598]